MSPLRGWAVCGTVGYKQDAPDGAKSERGLAGHNGFTPEELDFILNDDIKYRLGRDTEGEEE